MLGLELILFLLCTCQLGLSYKPPVLLEEPEDTFGYEKKPLTLKCRSTSSPPPRYLWFKDNNEIANSRHTITDQGDLLISPFVAAEDVGEYKCIVKVAIEINNAELKLVSRNAKVQTEVFPQFFASDVYATTGYIAGSLRLSVNTSNFNPQPNIGWNYRGKPSVQNNDPRFTVLPQGVLQISGLLSSDDGELRAVAYSKATSETMYGKFAKITVEEASLRPINNAFYFLGKPQNIELEWGYSTILEAFADSAAPVSYTWYKDGNKIKFNDRLSIFGKGNLKIQFSKDEDAGIYKVVAESAGQQIEASAQVKVNSPAQIVLSPPSQITATEESKVTVNFSVGGSSSVIWYHDGAIVDTAAADYLQFGSDYVIISNLIKSDAGMYQGRIGNTNIHMSFELIVVPKDTIATQTTVNSMLPPGKPLNVVAQARSSTEIDLKWQEPAISNGVILSYGIIFFSSLSTATRIPVSDPTQRFLTVKNLTPGTMYQFRIQAFNSNGPSLFSDVVGAKTNDEPNLPGIATNLKFLPFESSMTVSWDSPKSGAVQNYVVFYTPRGFSGNPLQKSASTTSLQIDNLAPGVSYRVWVVSYYNNIAGPRSEEVIVDFPNASEAPQSVTNFVGTPVLTTVTNLNWNPPLSGPVPTLYKVYYQDAEDSSSSLQVSSITSPPAIITNLQPNTLYEFYVIPFNGAVAGLKSSVTKVRTLEEVPPAPLSLKAVSIGSETLKVRWSPIDLKDFHGNLLSYELQYFEGDFKQAAKVISDIPKASSEWKITNLLPQTLYNLNVRGVSGSGQGAASPTISIKTRELTSEGPSEPAGVKFVHDPDAADVLMVTWDEPLYVTGDIKSYIVYYRMIPSDNWVSRTTIGSAKGYNITAIMFGKAYESYMVAVDSNGEGKKSPVLKKTTMIEDKQPDPVSQLSIVPKADSLLVSWEPPVSSSQVIVRGYKVSIISVKTRVEIFQNTLLGRKNTQVLLYNGIEPNERYAISVQALNQFGKSVIVKKEATTLQALKSAVLITSVTEGSNNILFKWVDTGIVSGVANYIVRYDVYDINGVPDTKNLAVFKNEAYIADLVPFTTYNFYVKHATETSFPTDVTVSARTLEAVPSAPLDLTAQGIGEYPSWLILSWQVPRYPNGKIKEYVILYSADETLDYKEWPKIETKSISMTHNITQLTAGTKYYFVVYAVNGAGEGSKSAMYSKTTVGGNAVVPIVPVRGASKADSSGGLELWWIILGIALFILLLMLLLLLIWCCCCRKDMALCWSCCPCCKKCWFCCCLPCCLFCCPCCCKKHKDDKNKLYITTPVLTLTTNEKLNGHTVNESKDVNVELVPLTSAADGEMYGGDAGFGTSRSRMTSSSLNSSKVSLANIKVPIPGDATFISYKTSLQDYCQNIGWVPPVYSTNQGNSGWLSKVSFGKIHSYDSAYDYGNSKQEAEQRAAHVGLIGLGVLDFRNKFSDDSCIAVPGQGDGSFISYKCSLHDFCQQCSLQPPKFVTSLYDNGYSSSVKVGNHTFNIIGRTSTSQEAEQKAALVALQGLCMVDSQAVYDPQACYTVPGPGDISFISFKSNLHDFCQRFVLPPPQYITNQGPQGFSAKLKFGGLFFQSNDFFQTRLEAEQHAAFEALQGLGLLESSVSFDSAWETNVQSSLVRGNSLKHGSGVITLGSVGGSLPRSYSRQSSRNHSRSGSVSMSRQGSVSELKPSLNIQADVVGVEMTRLPPAPNIQSNRDTAYSMGPRTYSSGSGFDRSSLNDRAGTYASLGRTPSNNNTLAYNTSITSSYAKDGLSASQTHIIHSTPYPEYNGGDALFRYDSDFNEVSSKVNYTSQQLNKKESYRIGSTYSSSSISMENSSNSQFNGPRSYAGSVRNVSYVETPRTLRTASHPALGDLESEMAGLEGLIKDLNGIASKAI